MKLAYSANKEKMVGILCVISLLTARLEINLNFS